MLFAYIFLLEIVGTLEPDCLNVKTLVHFLEAFQAPLELDSVWLIIDFTFSSLHWLPGCKLFRTPYWEAADLYCGRFMEPA